MDWTLEYLGTKQTLAEWGADKSSVLALQNQSAGILTLHFPGMLDADVPFAYKGKIILRLGDTIIFRGAALDPKREGAGTEEGITIQFVDGWWFLANGTIGQTIYDGAQSTTSRTGTLTSGSAVVALASTTGLQVGQTVTGTGVPVSTTIVSIGSGTMTLSAAATASGDVTVRFFGVSSSNVYAAFARLSFGTGFTRTSVSTTLSDIITACDAHHGGGVIAFGACHGDAFAILPQPIDIQGTFDTAVRTVLAFVPDAVSRMDYSTDPPQVSFYQRAAADAVGLNFADETVHVSQEIEARHDLVISGVRIIYQYFLTDGSPAMATDAAGDDAGPGVIQVEFKMTAPSVPPSIVPAVVESQELKTETVNVDSADWWYEHADLEVESADDIIVGEGSSLKLDADSPENAGLDEGELEDVGGCDKMILQGNIPGWFNQDAHLKYVAADGYLTLRIWNDANDHDKGYRVVRRHITLTFAATDLDSDTFTNEITSARTDGGTFDGEVPPSAIATAILNAQSALPFQGQVVLTGEECDFSFVPGKVLSISGSRDEWTAMKAQIQGSSFQLHTGRTTVTFGPAEHLAPQDYLQIVRRLGQLRPALQLESRAMGNSSGGDGVVHHPSTQVRMGVKQTDNVTESKATDGAGSVTKKVATGNEVWTDGTTTITVDASTKIIRIEGGGKSAEINLDDLPDGAEAKFREVTFCTSSGNKTASVLMTAPV